MASCRKGDKFGRRHSTIMDAATPIVDALASYDEVHKIVICPRKRSRRRNRRIKIREVSVGLRITVCGIKTLQSFYIHTKLRQIVDEKLREEFKKFF